MKKLTSILLLACFCFLVAGYHLVFHFQIEAAKSEMLVCLKNHQGHKDVIVLSLTGQQSKQLDWQEDHEFLFNGEMYDVVEKEQKGDRLIIRCIPDKKETALIEEYQKNNQRDHSHSCIQLVTIQFVLPSGYSIKPPQRTISKIFFDRPCSLSNPASSIFIPPPEVC